MSVNLLKQINLSSISMEISEQFIQDLFHHPQFEKKFEKYWESYKKGQRKQPSIQTESTEVTQIHTVVQEIAQLLQSNFQSVLQQQCSHLYESNRYVMEQLEVVKAQLKPRSNMKTQSSTAQRDTNPKLQTSIFFEVDSQLDMRQMRRQFEDSIIQNKILPHSFEIDQQQQYIYIMNEREKRYEQQIQQKINASLQGSINRIQLSLEEKFEKYSIKIEQMIQQLRKTIASIVEAMNEKECWGYECKTKNKQGMMGNNAFSKKEIKTNDNGKQFMIQKDTKSNKIREKQHEGQSFENQQKSIKTHQQVFHPIHHPPILHNPLNLSHQHQPNSQHKAIQSLNKSISLGRTKIKSLFGFKSSSSTSSTLSTSTTNYYQKQS